MMHEDVDDDEEEVILDRRTLIHPANDLHSSSNSGPILLGVNRFNIKVYDDPVKLSQAKVILLAATSIVIGMFTGLLGPTFTFLSQRMPADLSAVVWLIALKALGFLIGTILSSYLYVWFNVCCLLGLSCLAISFGVCSLPLITDLATFYLTSLILGVGLAISYNGIDVLYNRVWSRPSLPSVRWLHLLVAVGAILSTVMLFPSTISNNNEISSSTSTTLPPSYRPRREVFNEISSLLASMKPLDTDNSIQSVMNGSDLINQTDTTEEVLSTRTTSVPGKVITKPSIVDSAILKQSHVDKPTPEVDSSGTKKTCVKTFCCYHRNDTNLNASQPTNNILFTCKEKDDHPSKECNNILSACSALSLQICVIENTNTRCRIDQICTNDKNLECSISLIETAIIANTTTTTVLTTYPSTIVTTLSTIVTTTSTTTTTTTTTSTTQTTTTTTILTTTSTTTSSPTTTTTTTTTRRSKPSVAQSDIDDLSENLFYKKIRSFFQSITSVHLIYLFVAFAFFLLGVFYSTLAMRGEGIQASSSKSTRLNPLALLLGNSHRITTNSQTYLSLLSDRSSLKFVFLLLAFYFLMSGIESSCTYLTYLLGIQLKFSKHQSLLIEFLFFVGLLFGRLIDVLMDYGCFLFSTRITTRTKKQSDRFHSISIKFCILIRLILLFILCSTLSFSNLFQENSSNPSIHMFYFVFFLIGVLIASIPILILVWIERDLSLNESLVQMIFIAITISEIIFPSFLFHIIKSNVRSYLFYLFLGSSVLLILFVFILFIGKQWQRKKLYRILPTSLAMDEIDIENHSDGGEVDGEEEEEQQQHQQQQPNENYVRNGRMNYNESKFAFDNERAKGLKGH